MTWADHIERADRAVQANLGGVPVVYETEYGERAEVTGIFDETYVLVEGNAHAGVEQVTPAVFLRLSDLPLDPADDEPLLIIAEQRYRVRERRPDGQGGIRLLLHQEGC